jgi:hypothetical protein
MALAGQTQRSKYASAAAEDAPFALLQRAELRNAE